MRCFSLLIGISLAIAGCKSFDQLAASPVAKTPVHRPTPQVVAKPADPAPHAEPQAPPADQPAVQQVQHVEPAPAEPETLPPATLQPVVLGKLTLAELEQMAIAANPSVARAAALVDAARGNWIQVGLPPNPNVGYEGQQIGSAGRAEQDGVFIEQEIVRLRKLRLNREVAAQEIAKAEQQLAMQQQRVLTDVRIAYYEVLIAERQKTLTGQLRDIAAAALKVAEALLKGKEVGRPDVIQAQLEMGNAEILAQNAENRHAAAWRTLATIIGEPNRAPQPLDGNVDEPRPEHLWDESLQRLLSTSPEIALAASEIERARWAVERAYVEKKPNLTVQGLVNWRDNGIGGDSDGSLTVGIPLPLWNRNQGGIIQAEGQAAAAERALQQLELSLQNRLAPVFERYASALNQVTKYREKLLPAAQESLDLARRLYQAGETPYLNLLTAQRSFSQTNLNYLESLSELRSAEAEIEGLLLSGSLETR
jgi:cobalt-zinc-cadmium efflux system outer membrane protein